MDPFEKAAKKLQADANAVFQENPTSDHFFEISESVEPKEIGRQFPQIDHIDLSIAHAITFQDMPEEDLVLDNITLHKSAKWTDIISTAAISARGLLMSERALNIFSKYELGRHKIYLASIHHLGEVRKYGYLQIKNDLTSLLDYKKSEFYVAGRLRKPERDIAINDLKTYEEMAKKVRNGELEGIKAYSYLRVRRAYFQKGAIIPDFFTLKPCGTSLFITQSLTEELIRHKITGAHIHPSKKIVANP